MTNNEFFEIFSSYQQEYLSIRTYYARTHYLKNHFLPDFGEVTPSDITNADLQRTYDSMASQGLAANTIFGAYAAFLSYFKLAMEHGLISCNPASRR
ncbi:MAG: phage integrase SAM-like domain-containing protein [Clostridia bacterium]|nr:phage integrase SAM-like domain-containing protein [Clostridia bacterium]